jgi:tetratricopeptide (TPR) repeat protein
MKLSIEERFKNGIELRDNGNLKSAIEEFLFIVRDFRDHPKIGKVYTVLAGIYDDLGDAGNSLKYFKKATEANSSSELASLGLYLAYVKLGEDDEAVAELKRYLSENRADLYRETLEELLVDIAQGKIPKYKDVILDLAVKNNIEDSGHAT